MALISHQLHGLQIRDGTDKPTYGLQGALDLPIIEPTKAAYDNISTDMTVLYERLVPSPDYMNKRSRLIRRLQLLLNSSFPGAGLRLEVFGSYASGLGSESSDADLCITSDYFQKSGRYNDMRELARVLRRGGMIQVQAIAHAKVPIVKFVDPQSRINCDVNANHVLGIHNSELIRCYTLIDDRVRPFLYNLKALVKKHKINDSSQAWLSSYAYVMMAIGFLQAQDPPILPALQAQPQEHMTSLKVQMDHEGRGGKDLIDCTFDHDHIRHRGFGAPNTKTVGQLLVEFFEFYTRYYDYQTMEVNVRLGGGVRTRDDIVRLRKLAEEGNNKVLRQLPQPGRGEKKLIVMDPFIRDRNVAGSCSGRHLSRVWNIFESLYLTLSRGELQKALEPIPEYEGGREKNMSAFGHQGATLETHRPREKKTEREHERKKEQILDPASESSTATKTVTNTIVTETPVPQRALSRTTLGSEGSQITLVPAGEKPPLAPESEPTHLDKDEQQGDLEEEDDHQEDEHQEADVISKSRKRRIRRTVARTFHLAQAVPASAASTTIAAPEEQTNKSPSISAGQKSVATHAEAGSITHNVGHQHARAERTADLTSMIPSDDQVTSRPARRVIQTELIRALQDQKKHNELMDRSRHNEVSSALTLKPKPHRPQPQPQPQPHQHQPQQQQKQQQTSIFPVLAKTQKLLLTQVKNADVDSSPQKGDGIMGKNIDQKSKRGSRTHVKGIGSKEGL
ncbi:hypothetical protein BGX28_006767 [Mortierella sp. GBA30]|nr:hypothetical protein BGX28_006767 [Mortierella sp. GBA30]